MTTSTSASMARFSTDAVLLDLADERALWHRRTGRAFRLRSELVEALLAWAPSTPPPPPLRAVARRLHDLRLLAEDPAPDPLSLVACPSRLPLLLPDRPALWAPDPTTRTPGGFAFRALPLSAAEVALWRAANGARTLAQVAEAAGVSTDEAAAWAARLTDPAVQALQLRGAPPRAGDPSLQRLVAPPRPSNRRPADQTGAAGETTLGAYHAEIGDAERHFDDREITVAHAFATPHPALGGQPFGARLHRALHTRGLLPQDTALVLEIGGGDGELGADFWAAAQHAGLPPGPGWRLDASPALLAQQDEKQPHTLGLVGDATDLPMEEGALALVLCNEVLADLTAVPARAVHASGPPASMAVARARALLAAHGLPRVPDDSFYNLGAWQLVAELARTLRPGGVAYVSEFGAPDEHPTETTQLDHPEVSIHFGHLQALAERRGLEAELIRLDTLLDADLTERWLSRAHFDALRALWHDAGGRLAARAWTAETAPTPERVEGLADVPLSQDGPGPVFSRFWALLLRKPPAERP